MIDVRLQAGPSRAALACPDTQAADELAREWGESVWTHPFDFRAVACHLALRRNVVELHHWGTIQDGYLYCDDPGCRARRPIDDREALDFIYGPGA